MSLREPTASMLPTRMSIAPSGMIASSRISAPTRGRLAPARVMSCEQLTTANALLLGTKLFPCHIFWVPHISHVFRDVGFHRS